MKTIKCSDLGGGTCAFEANAATLDEAKEMMTDHAKIAHEDMMAHATPESMATWNATFDRLWEAARVN